MKGVEIEHISENDWTDLLENIKDKKCTPFIGAGTCCGILPLAREISEEWARVNNYPFEDKSDLARVSEFLAISRSGMYPRDQIKKLFKDKRPPDFSQPDEPHSILADLELPIYITTNYDDFMSQALKYHNKSDVKEDFCRWNEYIIDRDLTRETVFESGYRPTAASPLVFHFHGILEEPQSMVLTESDYLDFLIKFTRDDIKLPPPITKALAGTSLLFLGYSLADLNFRVLFRGLIDRVARNASYNSIAVQLPPSVPDRVKKDALAYLDEYLDVIHRVKIMVYWGDVRHFCKELRMRWKKDGKDAY